MRLFNKNIDYVKVYDMVFGMYQNYDTHKDSIYRFNFIIEEIQKNNYKKVIDISSGRGTLIKIIQNDFKDVEITSTDIKKYNNIDVEFVKLDLTNIKDYTKITQKYDLLICTDVLEHIEIRFLDDVLKFFKLISNNFCFTIANHSDIV